MYDDMPSRNSLGKATINEIGSFDDMIEKYSVVKNNCVALIYTNDSGKKNIMNIHDYDWL